MTNSTQRTRNAGCASRYRKGKHRSRTYQRPAETSVRLRRRCERRGAAAVEFAIVAPVFILMIIGFIELGRALMVQQVLTNASRVGARAAVTLNATQQDVIDVVESYTSNVSVSGAQVTVSPDPAAAESGDQVTVTVTVPFNNVSWLQSPWYLGGASLTGSSIMRKEGFE